MHVRYGFPLLYCMFLKGVTSIQIGKSKSLKCSENSHMPITDVFTVYYTDPYRCLFPGNLFVPSTQSVPEITSEYISTTEALRHKLNLHFRELPRFFMSPPRSD